MWVEKRRELVVALFGVHLSRVNSRSSYDYEDEDEDEGCGEAKTPATSVAGVFVFADLRPA